MSDQIYENDEEAIRGGDPAPAPAPDETPAEAPETPQEAPAWAAKWGTSDPAVAVEKAHQAWEEANRLISSTRPQEVQQQAQQQYQPPADPLAGLPPHIDEQTLGRVQQAFEANPGHTALYLAENEQYFGKKLVDEAWGAWMQADPRGYAAWNQQQAMQAWQQQWQTEQAPLENWQVQQISETAVAAAVQQTPEFDAYRDKIIERLQQDEELGMRIAHITRNEPARLVPELQRIYAQIRGEEWLQQAMSQPQQQPQQQLAVDSQKARARTETRSTATPEPNQDRDKALQNMILNARP